MFKSIISNALVPISWFIRQNKLLNNFSKNKAVLHECIRKIQVEGELPQPFVTIQCRLEMQGESRKL